MTKSVDLHFGCIADPLMTQLRSQGLKFYRKEMAHFQMDLDAINRLRVRRIIVESAADKAYKKLHSEIVSHVAKREGMKVKKANKA